MESKIEDKPISTAAEQSAQPTAVEQKMLEAVEQMQTFMNLTSDKLVEHGTDMKALASRVEMLASYNLKPLGPTIPESEEEYNKDDYERKGPRRDSYMASSALAGEVASRPASQIELPVNLLKVQKEVDPGLIIGSISIQALIQAKRNKDIWEHRNGQKRELVFFVSSEVHKKLIANEKRWAVYKRTDFTVK